MLTDRIEKVVQVGPETAVVGYIESKRKALPCKIFLFSLADAPITFFVNFNKPATVMERALTTTQRKLVVSGMYESNVYAADSIRFRVECEVPAEVAIKAEFEPPKPGGVLKLTQAKRSRR